MWGILLVGTALFAVTAAEMSFTCDFERDTCGFTNQEGLAAQWERKEVEIGGKKGYMMVVEPNGTTAHLAKMMTPYFEVEGELPGCLSFDLYLSGIRQFGVQQERNFGIISVWATVQGDKGAWQRPAIEVDVDESTRIFFETVLDGLESNALAAVDNVRLNLQKC